jgi:opine dehydrogenase
MHAAENYTVIGAGHGGKAMAAHLALKGVKVTLYNRTPDHVAYIKIRGGIELEVADDGPHGFAKLILVTSELKEALQNAEVIMVVVPSSAHGNVAKSMAPCLKNGQIVILHPGRTCGAIEFTKALRDEDCTADVTVAEAETFIYASRSDGPAQAHIFRIKEAVPLAALPATRTQSVLDAIKPVYPQYIDGGNVLKTGMNNMGAIFHPALQMAYDTTGDDLNEAIHNQPGYYGIKAPSSLNHRYIFEDVPMSLVPIASLGERFGVSVRGMESIIRLACIIHHTDYKRRGRTVDKLDIAKFSVSELTRYVNEGFPG